MHRVKICGLLLSSSVVSVCMCVCQSAYVSVGRNQLFVGVTGWLLDKLQSLQNAAAHLVTGARKFDRITPVMRELHWLPVRQRIRFKTAILVLKCLHGLAPEYLSEYCKLTTGRSHLRSANVCLLSVPRTRTTYDDRSFAVSGPVAVSYTHLTLPTTPYV